MGMACQNLAMANFAGNNVTVLLGAGDGTFTPASDNPIAVGSFPTSIAIGDFKEAASSTWLCRTVTTRADPSDLSRFYWAKGMGRLRQQQKNRSPWATILVQWSWEISTETAM